MKKPILPDSTVGITFYNLLTMVTGTMTLSQLVSAAVKMQHPTLKEAQGQRVVDELVARERIGAETIEDTIVYMAVASESLLVVQRDLSDFDPKTGEGGWEGWQVKDPKIRSGSSLRPLEEILGQAPTNVAPRRFKATPERLVGPSNEMIAKRKARAERRDERDKIQAEKNEVLRARTKQMRERGRVIVKAGQAAMAKYVNSKKLEAEAVKVAAVEVAALEAEAAADAAKAATEAEAARVAAAEVEAARIAAEAEAAQVAAAEVTP